MNRFTPAARVLIACVALAPIHLSARAQQPKTVEEIMEFSAAKMADYKTWSADYTQTISMLGGQMTMSGRLLQKPPRKMRMQVDMPMMGQQGKMTMVLGDDGILWQEMDLAGQKQIIKMDMSKAMGNAVAKTGIKIDPLEQMDPSKQWQASKEMFDFSLAGSTELHGQPMYVLEGVWKQAALTNQQMAMVAAMIGKSRVHIGQNDGFVHKMEQFDKSNTNIIMSMQFKNLRFNEDIPDSTFLYQPPPNVPIMDMTQMMEMQLGAQPATPSQPPPQTPPANE